MSIFIEVQKFLVWLYGRVVVLKSFLFRSWKLNNSETKVYFSIGYVILVALFVTSYRSVFSYFFAISFFYFGYGVFLATDSPYIEKYFFRVNFIFNFIMCFLIYLTFLSLLTTVHPFLNSIVAFNIVRNLIINILMCYSVYFFYLCVRVLIKWEDILKKLEYWFLFKKGVFFLFLFLIYYVGVPFVFFFLGDATPKPLIFFFKVSYIYVRWVLMVFF